jgi:hypothetical protein
MPSSFTFRFLQGATWGIYVELTAELATAAGVASPLRQVAEGVSLCIQQPLTDREGRTICLTQSEVEWLCRGIRLVADKVRATAPAPVIVHLLQVTIAPCDYQEEGLACGIAGWLAREVGFEPPPVHIQFEKTQNRYAFTFPEAPRESLAT